MGRRPKQLDVTLDQAEEFLYLARLVLDQERKLRVLRNVAGQNWLEESEKEIVDDFICRSTREYMELVRELTESVMSVVKNPLFWSAQIPLWDRTRLAVLLDAPLKPELAE